MTDVHSKEVRSYNMSQIRSKNTQPEILLRKFLHAQGFRFRLHNKKLPGTPDIVLPKLNTVIFVHGCFWHHHKDCRFAKFPVNNSTYWTPKILKNISRDKENKKGLKKSGWKVITVWTCKLKHQHILKTFAAVKTKLS